MHTKYGNNQNPPVFLTYNMPYAYLNTIEECAKIIKLQSLKNIFILTSTYPFRLSYFQPL